LKLAHLWPLFKLAQERIGHSDYTIMGSLSVLGVEEHHPVPPEMSLSIDIDCFTTDDPARIFDLHAELGEDSPFHLRHGYYLDPISPSLPTLAPAWDARALLVEGHGMRLRFLEPNDAALSKYARGEPRDVRWIRAGLAEGLVSLPVVKLRAKGSAFLDNDEALRVHTQLEADSAWLQALRGKPSARVSRATRQRPPEGGL
jgi:hypothetical protein